MKNHSAALDESQNPQSRWSKDTWKSRPKWKPFSRYYPQRNTFWSEKVWRKPQILLVKYASLTWQSTAWRTNQMLTPELLPFSCCCLLCVVNNYCCAIWIPYSQTFHMQYFSNTWCWAFVVTLRAAEWITSSVGFFLFLQMAWCLTYLVTGSSWMVYR